MATNPLIAGPEPTGADIEIAADGAQIAAYESRPASGGSAPAVIVIHENRGLVPYLRDVADGLASSGYIAVAPDLMSRDGGTASIEDVPAKLGEIPRERHVSDVQAVIAYLKAQPGRYAHRHHRLLLRRGHHVARCDGERGHRGCGAVLRGEPASRPGFEYRGRGLRRLWRERRAHQRGHPGHHQGVGGRGHDVRYEGVRQRGARVPQSHECGALRARGCCCCMGRRPRVVRHTSRRLSAPDPKARPHSRAAGRRSVDQQPGLASVTVQTS